MKQWMAALLLFGILLWNAVGGEIFSDQFKEAPPGKGLPPGWKLFLDGPGREQPQISVEEKAGRRQVVFDDHSKQNGFGMFRDFPVQPGRFYRATVETAALPGRSVSGAFLQLLFLPSQKMVQVPLAAGVDGAFSPTVCTMRAPEGATSCRLYLYSHFEPCPGWIIRSVKLEDNEQEFPAHPRLLLREDFNQAAAAVPKDWHPYQQGPKTGLRTLKPDNKNGKALELNDICPKSEIGISRPIPVHAGRHYRIGVDAARPKESADKAAYQLQLTFFPSSRHLIVPLSPTDEEFEYFSGEMVAPEGTTQARLYLYSRFEGVGKILIDNIEVWECAGPFPKEALDPQKDFGALEVTPRDLRIRTELVKDGKPVAEIAVPDRPEYQAMADRLNAAVKEKTGVSLPVVSDQKYREFSNLKNNVIFAGNRDANAGMEQLYLLYYHTLDAKYPGRNGHVVRSLHNPFGDGFNALLAAGSDDQGTAAAVDRLAALIREQPAGKDLALGYLADIRLGDNLKVPANAGEAKLWQESLGYGSKGIFGWNSISKNMALFYMTGDQKFAREFLRLAFPTPEVTKELIKVDAEAYDDPKMPLVKPYHYQSIAMMLYWDLIEEDPFFTEEQRTAVTKKFYEQLNFWRTSGYFGGYKIFNNPTPHEILKGRHYTWEALSVYVLCRYFDKYYPCKDSRVGLRCVRNTFATLDEYASTNVGSLFWYNTFLAPAIHYATLAGGRKYVDSPVIRAYAEGLAMLSDRKVADWSNSYSAGNFLTQLAYLTQDQAFMELYENTGMNPDEFRLGQSFWPAAPYPRNFFRDSAGKVLLQKFANPSGLGLFPPFEPSRIVEWLSYREKADGYGDFLLMDTKYESGRNPFHNFAILNLELDGTPLLRGYHNQPEIFSDGLAALKMSNFSDISTACRIGSTVLVRAKIGAHNHHDWYRTLILLRNRALILYDYFIPDKTGKTSQISNNFEFFRTAQVKEAPTGDYQITLPVEEKIIPDQVFLAANGRDILKMAQWKDQYYSSFLESAGFRDLKPGETLQLTFDMPREVDNVETFLTLIGHDTLRGRIRISFDGKVVEKDLNHLTSGYTRQNVLLQRGKLAAGSHRIDIEALSVPKGAQGALVTIAGLRVARTGFKPQPQEFQLGCSMPAALESKAVTASSGSSGKTASFVFSSPATQNIHFVSVLRKGQEEKPQSICAEDDDVFALTLPEPALLTVRDTGLLLKSPNLVLGIDVKRIPNLLNSDRPIIVECEPETGKLAILAPNGAQVNFRDKSVPALTLGKGESTSIRIPPPENLLEPDHEQEVATILQNKPKYQAQSTPPASLIELWKHRMGNTMVTDLVAIPETNPAQLAAICGKNLELLTADGKTVWKQELAAPIGALHYWESQKLIVVGCLDEKVCAFTLNGVKKWEFTSEMAQELVDSMKYYWFKSAIPGVTALSSVHLGERDLLFVGSAGTVEILDTAGKLLKRHWQTWGAVTGFAYLPAQDGNPPYMYCFRYMGGWPTVYRVNPELNQESVGMFTSKTGLDMGSLGFSMIGRNFLIASPLEKNGPWRLISDFNGALNRLVIWDPSNHKQIEEINFGPGFVASGVGPGNYGKVVLSPRNVRGVVVTDFENDGNREIVTAFNRKCLIAFDRNLKTLWYAQLPENPSILQVFQTAAGIRIVAGCFGGTVSVFDAQGKEVFRARMPGTPGALLEINGKLIAGDAGGNIQAWKLP